MLIQVNGDTLEVQESTSVAGLIESMQLGERRVAVELNLEIVPRSRPAETVLQEGDRVEVVPEIGGGCSARPRCVAERMIQNLTG